MKIGATLSSSMHVIHLTVYTHKCLAIASEAFSSSSPSNLTSQANCGFGTRNYEGDAVGLLTLTSLDEKDAGSDRHREI
jgi:hypothetical protein